MTEVQMTPEGKPFITMVDPETGLPVEVEVKPTDEFSQDKEVVTLH